MSSWSSSLSQGEELGWAHPVCHLPGPHQPQVGLAVWVGGLWSLLGGPKACEGFLSPSGLVTRLSSSWAPVEGTRDVCSCCEMRSCGLARHSRRLPAPSRWQGGRIRRELPSQLGTSLCASWSLSPSYLLAWSWVAGAALLPVGSSVLIQDLSSNEFGCLKVLPFRSLGGRSRRGGGTSLHLQLAGSPSSEDAFAR